MIRVLRDVVPAEIIAIQAGGAPSSFIDEYLNSDVVTRRALHLPSSHKVMPNVRVTVMRSEEKNYVLIASDSSEGPGLIFGEELLHYRPAVNVQNSSIAQTVTGKMVIFYKTSGCNCGSRLRSWSPYKAFAQLTRGETQ